MRGTADRKMVGRGLLVAAVPRIKTLAEQRS
jgi:hypothetical protein